MAKGIVHRQPVFFESPLKEPRAFLETLPSPVYSPSSSSRGRTTSESAPEKGLLIAWRPRSVFGSSWLRNLINEATKECDN